MPVYLFWGEEDYNIENAVNDLKNKILDPEWALLNHKILKQPDITTLTEALQVTPMAFGNLLVEIRSSSYFMRGNKALTGSDAQINKLVSALENINPDVYVLFICPIDRNSGRKIDSSLKIVKAIEKTGKIQPFEAFKSYQEDKLVSWIIQRANAKGCKISKDSALNLFRNTGPELRKLDSELEKLVLNAYPNKTITNESIQWLGSSYENIFTLADFWLQNKTADAMTELNKLLEKDHALRIIATLRTIIRKWLKIKIESRNKDAFEISKIVNSHKFVVEKDLQKLKNISVERLVELGEKLVHAEYSIKSGRLEPEMSLEIAIAS